MRKLFALLAVVILTGCVATKGYERRTLASDEEKSMRSVLNDTGDDATQAAVQSMVNEINDTFASEGGGGDSGGGDSGGGDGGGSGGSASDADAAAAGGGAD